MIVRAGDELEGHEHLPADTTDWQITFLYYILCIQIKALASSRGMDLQDHSAIKGWINSEKDILPIATTYRKAEEWSRDARCEGRNFTKDEMHRFLRWFCDVHAHLRTLLKADGLEQPACIDPHALLGIA